MGPFLGRGVDGLRREIGEAVADGLTIHHNIAMSPPVPAAHGCGVHERLLPRLAGQRSATTQFDLSEAGAPILGAKEVPRMSELERVPAV